MDVKGFDRLQTALQWVADEERARGNDEETHLAHEQETWAWGEITGEYDGPAINHIDGMPAWYEKALGKQYVTICATSCCVAGNVVIANGDTILANTHDIARRVAGAALCVTPQGRVMSIGKRAQELLGIGSVEAQNLFDAGNEPWTLYQVGAQIAARYGHDLQVI